MGKFEVTQEQWVKIMGYNRSEGMKERRRPINNVSWFEVQEFLRRLNKMVNTKRYRLPTEAEWEYAARAGSTAVYSFGDDASQLEAYAWYGGNSGKETHPVGQKRQNAWGLYDMHGNVWEWVQDRHGDYNADAVVDPQGPYMGWCRVIRGGSWDNNAGGCRLANRDPYAPANRYCNIGFRLVLSPGY